VSVATTQTDPDSVRRPGPSVPVIVETKLARPPVRATHVTRGELLAFLAQGVAGKLTLLTAPPGFGKTTLLAEWASVEEGRATAWVSLDDDDNDPARFFAYVVAAVRTVEPEFGARTLAAHATPGVGLVDVVLPLFLNEVAGLDKALVLVLDDYHMITNTDIHEGLTYLVERLPDSLHVVVATRQDPPLPLGRLRARGELAELRAGELRFSDEEATTFLNGVLELDLTEEDVERLQARTEGWPAALYLAALSLRGEADPSGSIDEFAGDDRHLVDYLTGELLARQSPELRAFLLHTSILKRLCGPLCDAVANRDDSTEVLEELERSNLLLIPLDLKREWYRYHPLFADLLQHELARTEADVIPQLHGRASRWYRQAGLIVEAANHATAAGDVDAAVELVGRYYSLFLGQGQLATVARWLDALPESVIADDWLLCFAAAMVTSHMGRLDEAEHWLALAEQAPPLVRNGQEPAGPLAALQAWLRLLRGDTGATIAAARRALSASATAEPGWTLGPQILLAQALWWSEQSTEAKAVLEEVTRTAQRAELYAMTVFALGCRAAIELEEEDAAQAETLACEAIELMQGAKLDENPLSAIVRILLGRIQTRRGELSEASDTVERGIRLAERVGAWHITTYGLLALAEIRQREHQPAAARRLLTRARDMLEPLPDPGAGLERIVQTEKTLRLRAARRDAARASFWELSERELAVLRLLPSRLSQREIAAELYVSFNTVKTHTRAIFRKLGVASRAEAVARARELGLL
jgi:LuxR family transcriptional regulator, maltose regulon positive regulatory protein